MLKFSFIYTFFFSLPFFPSFSSFGYRSAVTHVFLLVKHSHTHFVAWCRVKITLQLQLWSNVEFLLKRFLFFIILLNSIKLHCFLYKKKLLLVHIHWKCAVKLYAIEKILLLTNLVIHLLVSLFAVMPLLLTIAICVHFSLYIYFL